MGLFRLRLLLKRNKMSLVIPPTFQHILRVMNTNIDGKRNIQYAITAIKGVGRRYANIVLKKADIDLTKRAGELSEEDVEKIITIMSNPRLWKQYPCSPSRGRWQACQGWRTCGLGGDAGTRRSHGSACGGACHARHEGTCRRGSGGGRDPSLGWCSCACCASSAA